MDSPLDSLEYIHWFIEAVVYKDSELFIQLIEAETSDQNEDLLVTDEVVFENLQRIESTENSKRYTVHFTDVILYQAYDECSHLTETDKCDEGVISECKNTGLLTYIKEHTLLNDTTPGEFEHYCIKTAEDWYHVLSREEPKVYETKNA